MPAKREISLLPEKENSNSTLSRLLLWGTTVGRFVIVFTELIVITAFISRFWLDRTNSDLSEKIRQQKAILASTGNFEKEYSLLQQRLKFINTTYLSLPEFKSKIDTLSESTPPEVVFESLNLSQGNKKVISASLSLVAYKEESLVDFITNLMLNPNIAQVDIQTVEKRLNESRYLVSLSLIFNQKVIPKI